MSAASSPPVVRALYRYPVKSVGGEALESAEITELGIVGDRAAGILDEATGNVLTARRTPELLFASARWVDDDVVLTLPDGTVTADDAELSSWLGRDVRLVRAADLDTGGTYENPLDPEGETDWVSWTGPSGAFHDSTRARLSLVGEETLGAWPVARFRTNVVLSGGGEDAWVGCRISLGSSRLDVRRQIDRCVMVTRPQPGGIDRDLDVLRTINAQRQGCLSIGALVDGPGRVAIGDTSAVIDGDG